MKICKCIAAACIAIIMNAYTATASWEQTEGIYGAHVGSFAVNGPNIFAGTWESGVFRSTNNGANWTAVNTGMTNPWINALAVSGANLFAGTSEGVFVSSNNGGSWTKSTTGMTQCIVRTVAVIGTNLFAGTQDSGVFRSTNNGSSWTKASTGLTNTSIIILAVNGTNLFAGTPAGVFISADSGTIWTEVSTGLTNKKIIALAVSGTYLFAGIDRGGVFCSTNNGGNWTAVNSGLPYLDVGMVAAIGSTIFTRSGGELYHSIDNGASWTKVNSGLSSTVYALAASGTTLLAGTYGGVFLSTDDAANWSVSNAGLTGISIRSFILSGSTLFAGTDGNGVYRSIDNGATWATVNTGLTSLTIGSFAVSGTNLFTGTNGCVFRSANNGDNWTELNARTLYTGVSALAAIGTTIFAGTYVDGMFLSTNNGDNWTKINSGLTNTEINALAFIGTNIFAGTARSGVFCSTNNGSSWAAVNTGMTGSEVRVLAVSDTTLFAVTSSGVFLSTNNGSTWTAANSGIYSNALYALTVRGATLFTGSNGGGVYLSTNNAGYWTGVNDGLANKYIRALVTTDTYLFAGTTGSSVWRRPLSDMIVSESPVPVSPANSSTNQPLSLSLAWSAATGAATYRVQLSSVADFTSAIIIDDSTLSTTTKDVGPLANSTTFYWRVRAKNTAGSSDWSATWSFTTLPVSANAPTLVSPNSGASDQPLSLTLSWSAATGASTYRVQLSGVADFTSAIIVDDSTLTKTTKDVGPLANNATYYWRVRAKNGAGSSDWSAVGSFATIPALPGDVVLSLPPAGTVMEVDNITLLWNKASSDPDRYALEVYGDSLLSVKVAVDTTLTDTTKTISSLENRQSYWWHVKAHNRVGWGNFSELRKFSVNLPSVAVKPAIYSCTIGAMMKTGSFITYSLPAASMVSIELYTIQGKRLATLLSTYQQPGYYRVPVAVDGFANGYLILRFKAGAFTSIRRIASF